MSLCSINFRSIYVLHFPAIALAQYPIRFIYLLCALNMGFPYFIQWVRMKTADHFMIFSLNFPFIIFWGNPQKFYCILCIQYIYPIFLFRICLHILSVYIISSKRAINFQFNLLWVDVIINGNRLDIVMIYGWETSSQPFFLMCLVIILSDVFRKSFVFLLILGILVDL